MSEIKVICPNHGIIKRLEMDCFWKGDPTSPEISHAHCPMCGAKTVIEYPPVNNHHNSWTYRDGDKCDRHVKIYY